MILRILFITLILMTASLFAQTQPPLELGVSQSLARWRAANYSDVRYKLNITLEKGAPLMRGELEIHVTLTDAGAQNDLILDWRTTQFKGDKDKPYAYVRSLNDQEKPPLVIEAAEHLRISREGLKKGENIIKIDFASPIKTSGAAVTRYLDKEDGGEYVYSLFVPSDASTAFPSFDQPDLKARFQLRLKTPPDWIAVGNTKSTKWINADAAGPVGNAVSANHNNEFEFKETKPISTYVFAFAAGDFVKVSEQKATAAGTSLQKVEPSADSLTSIQSSDIYVRKSQAEKFKQHAAEVFRLNREGVKFLESYFDYKFPFPKYDLVLIPEFPFGGMEHAGATFLREDRIIFPTEPTKNDYITRANVIFHEAAHQWFGDTVTMKWFDDLWLKEGFAEFMAYKTMEKVMPEYNAWKIFYERNKQAAYLTDSTKGTTPIYQEISNLSAAKSAYGNIVYRKAPSFLRQAEFYLGGDKFQTAVRAFLKKHEFANAEWTDLVKEFETASGQDLKEWGKSWATQRGMPIFRTVRDAPKHAASYYIVQNDILENKGYWKTKFKVFTIDVSGRNSFEETEFLYSQNYSEKFTGFLPTEAVGATDQFKFIFPNYQDYGYGIFLLDEKSRDYILQNIQNEKDDFLRTMMWGSLWDSVRETELAPKDYVELVVKNINLETDESTIQTLLGRVSTAMNYYLSDAQRAELAPRVEAALIDKIQNAPTPGQRITFYRAFLNVASSENARTVLKQILNNDLGEHGGNTKMRPGVTSDKSGKLIFAANPAITLKTKDRFDIVTKLLILGDQAASDLLAGLEKQESGDDVKRYAFAAKAGIATAENKAKFWNDFIGNKDISESYIESAFGTFNSPRQADLTLPYLEKALAELPNLKKNRKIFFVNGWLSAFIGGQKNEQALTIINKFLADNPNLDKDLRLKILENADGLERAVKIRAKYEK